MTFSLAHDPRPDNDGDKNEQQTQWICIIINTELA